MNVNVNDIHFGAFPTARESPGLLKMASEVADPPIARKLSFSVVTFSPLQKDESELPAAAVACPPARLKVQVRVRNLPDGEEASDMVLSESSVTMRKMNKTMQGGDSVEETSYSFDRVYPGDTTQAQVYEGAMKPQVHSFLSGQDTLTFGYGTTNAGKTYTIQGSETQRGMLPRALDAIFVALAAHRMRREGEGDEAATAAAEAAGLPALDDTCTYALRATFLEVYGNDAYDLFAPSTVKDAHGATKRVGLRVKENSGSVFVEGLREVELPDRETALSAIQMGWLQRSQGSNGFNDVSSRSHAVICLTLLATRQGADAPTATRLCLVDLAGAESNKKKEATDKRLVEAKSINQDLMTLGACLRDLRWNQTHPKAQPKVPPFRDSRITMLFRDYLSGNGQISVIAAVSPRQTDAHGTLETLRFASTASSVKILEKPKPAAPTKQAPLPRVAALAAAAGAISKLKGEIAAPKPEIGAPKPTPVQESISSTEEVPMDDPAQSDTAYVLTQQLAQLQQQLVAAQTDRVSLSSARAEPLSAPDDL